MPARPSRPIAPPLVLLGGTFDPPHLGHLILAECARYQFGAMSIVFLPAGEPYRKAGRAVTAAAHRVAMTQLAIASDESFELDEREVRRPGPTYTVDTLEALHAEGRRNIILILGEDAVADMPNWKHPARIRELATIAVAPKHHASGRPATGEDDPVVAMPPIAISSTLVRERVCAGEPIRYLVPDAVERYIREHDLYRP